MTVRSILTRAARMVQESNEGQRAPTAWVANEIALNAFNDVMRDMRGVQIGQRLTRDFSASSGATASAGYIYKCNVFAPPEPFNGDRFQVIGARTVTASDDTIETLTSVTTTESASWMYREDLGDWQREGELELSDASPLQAECDEALSCLIAARIYLEQMGELTPTLSNLSLQGRSRIRQLYGAKGGVAVDGPLRRGIAQRRCG